MGIYRDAWISEGEGGAINSEFQNPHAEGPARKLGAYLSVARPDGLGGDIPTGAL